MTCLGVARPANRFGGLKIMFSPLSSFTYTYNNLWIYTVELTMYGSSKCLKMVFSKHSLTLSGINCLRVAFSFRSRTSAAQLNLCCDHIHILYLQSMSIGNTLQSSKANYFDKCRYMYFPVCMIVLLYQSEIK